MDFKFFSVGNDFYQDKFDDLCSELEKGGDLPIHISVSCIGHYRQEWVEAKYVDQLRKKYGDRLVYDDSRYFATCRLV